jgi:hypothetical protein
MICRRPYTISLARASRARDAQRNLLVRLNGPDRRDALKEHLDRRQISTEIYDPRPMHLQSCFASLRSKRGPASCRWGCPGDVGSASHHLRGSRKGKSYLC